MYSGKNTSCVLTENGFCHLIFDCLSLIENCALAISGAFFIQQTEDFFNQLENVYFCTIVICTHLMGLLMKLFYYQKHHPWMSLSLAYKCLSKVFNTLVAFLGVIILVAMPVIGFALSEEPSSPTTASIILYVVLNI